MSAVEPGPPHPEPSQILGFLLLGSGLSHPQEPLGQSFRPPLYLLLWAFPWPRVSMDPFSWVSRTPVSSPSLLTSEHLRSHSCALVCTPGFFWGSSCLSLPPARGLPASGPLLLTGAPSPSLVTRPSSSHFLCVPPQGRCGFPRSTVTCNPRVLQSRVSVVLPCVNVMPPLP